MASFPKREAEILSLAELMKTGLKDNPAIFPSPPTSWISLNLRKNLYYTKRDTALAAAANAEAAVTAKDEAPEALTDAMKADLRCAENTVDFDDDKLKLIGWSAKKAVTTLTPPGQPRLAEAPRQGEGWVFLDWKPPADGGRPAAYTIERRERPSGPDLEYRIIAVNKAGESTPSNTIMVVL
jgi:hypothetical protein